MEVIELLRKSSKKVTRQRADIYKVMLKSQSPLTAQEVYKEVKRKYPPVSLDTIYRNLSMLAEQGFISQLRFQTKANSLFEHQHNQHHHHAICITCESAFCIEDCLSQELPKKPTKDKGFQIVSHIFEIYGLCSQCQQ